MIKGLNLAFLYIKVKNNTVKLELDEDDQTFMKLKGEIAGPPETPFEG